MSQPFALPPLTSAKCSMPEPIRGKAHTPALSTQVRDFSGLRYNNITPTDIDAFMDFGDKLFIIIEAKLSGADMPYGQRLALMRLVDACHSANGRKAIGVVCEHGNRTGEIDFANSIVVSVYWDRKWHSDKRRRSVRALIDSVLAYYKLAQYLPVKKAAA